MSFSIVIHHRCSFKIEPHLHYIDEDENNYHKKTNKGTRQIRLGEPIENGGFKAIKSGKGTKFMNANDLFDDRTSDEDFVPNYEDASEEESLYASDIEKEAKDNNYVYRGGF
ncbi:hypothetical protein JHK87_024625 [Glycine soja]|nr:hypothetical protein JHK87_024625 [Glycine soja]